jgi:hypothetical protein
LDETDPLTSFTLKERIRRRKVVQLEAATAETDAKWSEQSRREKLDCMLVEYYQRLVEGQDVSLSLKEAMEVSRSVTAFQSSI